MEPSFTNYMLIWYLCPVGFFLAIAAMLTIMKKSARDFIVCTVLGIQCQSSSEPKKETKKQTNEHTNERTNEQTFGRFFCSSCWVHNPPFSKGNNSTPKEKDIVHLQKYLYVNSDKNKDTEFTPGMRLVSYALTTTILTVFLTVLFEGCILSTKGVIVGKDCPDFDAHCFDTTDVFHAMGPFVCTPGEKADFNISVHYMWCVGWVIDRQDVNNVLEKIGTCGGLLGIISCIVPLVYYISHYESCPWKGWFWIWVPLSPIIALITIGLYMRPARPSMLVVITLSLVFCMALGGWIWAMFSAHKKKYKEYPCRDCCVFRYFSKCCQRQNTSNAHRSDSSDSQVTVF